MTWAEKNSTKKKLKRNKEAVTLDSIDLKCAALSTKNDLSQNLVKESFGESAAHFISNSIWATASFL